MFRRYIMRTKQAGTLFEHFIVTDTHNGNLTVGVYHRESNARQRVEILNSLEKSGPSIWAQRSHATQTNE